MQEFEYGYIIFLIAFVTRVGKSSKMNLSTRNSTSLKSTLSTMSYTYCSISLLILITKSIFTSLNSQQMQTEAIWCDSNYNSNGAPKYTCPNLTRLENHPALAYVNYVRCYNFMWRVPERCLMTYETGSNAHISLIDDETSRILPEVLCCIGCRSQKYYR